MDSRSVASSELVARLRTGDEAALDALMVAHQDALYRYALGLVTSADIAADVVQDVFVRVWESRATLHVDGAIRGYLFRAVRNAALNRVVSDTARLRRDAVAGPHAMGSSVTPDDVVEQAELEQAIRRAVGMLPPRSREIFVLVREHGLSYPEVASTLGISLSTVKTHMGRAMSTLLVRLAPFLSIAFAGLAVR